MGGTRVYVGKLSYDAQAEDLERFFKGYGKILDILMKNGFAFVEFSDYRDADDAVFELNGKKILGDRVILEIARGPSRRSPRGSSFGFRRRGSWLDKYGAPSRTKHRLVVENLSTKVSWQDLKDYMRQAGEVTYADAHKRNRNEGVVEFASYSDMRNAYKKLNNSELNGRRIKLIEDGPRHDRSRSRSRSVSRSRSKSRSRSRLSRRDTRSRSKSRSKSRSRSMSRSKSRDRSASKSPAKETRREMSSRSRSPSPAKYKRGSRSLSKSPQSDTRGKAE